MLKFGLLNSEDEGEDGEDDVSERGRQTSFNSWIALASEDLEKNNALLTFSRCQIERPKVNLFENVHTNSIYSITTTSRALITRNFMFCVVTVIVVQG